MSDPQSRWQIMDETLGRSRGEMIDRHAELMGIVTAWNAPLARLLDKSFDRAIRQNDLLREMLREAKEEK